MACPREKQLNFVKTSRSSGIVAFVPLQKDWEDVLLMDGNRCKKGRAVRRDQEERANVVNPYSGKIIKSTLYMIM